MWSYIAAHQPEIDRSRESLQTWESTRTYNAFQCVRKAQLTASMVELFFLVSALVLLSLSQQTWPSGFWLNHSAVLITSSVVCAVLGLDILIALITRLYYHIKYPFTTPEFPAVQPDPSTASQWETLCLQLRSPYTSSPYIRQLAKIYVPFCQALAKQGIDPQLYDLVVFRPARSDRVGLFSEDGAAPGFTLCDAKDENPVNLSNYSPNKILVVTFFDHNMGQEEYVIKDPAAGSNPEIKAYLDRQYVHIHFNQNDLQNLQENQHLSLQLIKALNGNT